MCKGMDKNNYRKGNNFSQVKRNKIQGSSNSSRALKTLCLICTWIDSLAC